MQPEEAQPPQRRARRTTDRHPDKKQPDTEGNSRTVGVDSEAHTAVKQQTRKLKIRQRCYASACILYFAENGLDPTKSRTQTLATVATRVGEAELNLREHAAKIGNRLVEILRAWEKQQYQQMMLIQASHVKHLESVEANLLRYLALLQDQSLAPALETLIKYGIDANISRKMSERVFMQLTNVARSEWQAQHLIIDKNRDEILVAELRKLLKQPHVSPPVSTTGPRLTPVPPPAGRPAPTNPPPGATPGATPAAPPPPTTPR